MSITPNTSIIRWALRILVLSSVVIFFTNSFSKAHSFSLNNSSLSVLESNIVSKNLYLNLINVDDIVSAVKMILKKEIQAGNYVLKNSKYFNIYKLIKFINQNNDKKMNIKWESNKIIKDEILNYKELKSWNPKQSNIKDIKNLILKRFDNILTIF